MTLPVIYWRGGEDSELFAVSVGNAAVTTTAATFRSGYARCALRIVAGASGIGFWQSWPGLWPGSLTAFWLTAQINAANSGIGGSRVLMELVDASNATRFRIRQAGSVTTVGVYKVNTAGTETLLTNSLSAWVWTGGSVTQLVVECNNAVSGTFNVYLAGVKMYAFSGDTTTETTAIAGVRVTTNCSAAVADWSEFVLSDSDARSMSLVTLAPVANGNTHNFDTGSPAAANVNETSLSDATLDGSTTAGQIQQYTIGSLPAGTFSILDFCISIRGQKGASGPSKLDGSLRISSTDYASSDQSMTTAWANYQPNWATDPSTSAAWAALPTNIGVKSVT